MSSLHYFRSGAALAAGILIVLVPVYYMGLHYSMSTNNQYLSDFYTGTESAIIIRADQETGCEYVISGGAMTVRLNAQGQAICGK